MMPSVETTVKFDAERGDVEHELSVLVYLEGPVMSYAWGTPSDEGYIDGDESRPLVLTEREKETAVELAHEWLRGQADKARGDALCVE